MLVFEYCGTNWRAIPAGSEAIVVHVTLAVLNKKELRGRLRGRGINEPLRQAKRYLSKFDSIWRLQTFLVSEAERLDSPVIPNDDKEAAIFQIIGVVNAELARHFHGKPWEVFGGVAKQAQKKSTSKLWQELLPKLVTLKKSRT